MKNTDKNAYTRLGAIHYEMHVCTAKIPETVLVAMAVSL